MKKRIFAVLLAASMMAMQLAGCSGSSSSSAAASTAPAEAETEAQTTAAAAEEEEKAEADAPEGSFVGEAEGRNGIVKVALTFDADGKIASVDVIEHEETEGVGTLATEQLPPLMVAGNTINVDAIATATITSEAVKEAARLAIV